MGIFIGTGSVYVARRKEPVIWRGATRYRGLKNRKKILSSMRGKLVYKRIRNIPNMKISLY